VNGDGSCGTITTKGVTGVEKASFASANATSNGEVVEAALVAAARRVDPNATARHLPAEEFKSVQEQKWKGSPY
jgi:hypothetical protein